MAILKIEKIPSEILSTPTSLVEAYDDELLQLIEDLKDTMKAEGGIGLAANQIGKSLSVFVIDVDGNGPKVFINPEITHYDSPTKIQEGCLSIPGAFMWNDRYSEVDISFRDEKWTLFDKEHFSGKEAIAIQHEVDHLRGKLFIDDFGQMRRELALKKHKKFMKASKKSKARIL
jgi:peptide deformylase